MDTNACKLYHRLNIVIILVKTMMVFKFLIEMTLTIYASLTDNNLKIYKVQLLLISFNRFYIKGSNYLIKTKYFLL